MNEKQQKEFKVVWRHLGNWYTAVVWAKGRRKASAKLERRLLRVGIKSYAVESVEPLYGEVPL